MTCNGNGVAVANSNARSRRGSRDWSIPSEDDMWEVAPVSST
jgi:hypothetical protein